jgi:hypothetical protein
VVLRSSAATSNISSATFSSPKAAPRKSTIYRAVRARTRRTSGVSSRRERNRLPRTEQVRALAGRSDAAASLAR